MMIVINSYLFVNVNFRWRIMDKGVKLSEEKIKQVSATGSRHHASRYIRGGFCLNGSN